MNSTWDHELGGTIGENSTGKQGGQKGMFVPGRSATPSLVLVDQLVPTKRGAPKSAMDKWHELGVPVPLKIDQDNAGAEVSLACLQLSVATCIHRLLASVFGSTQQDLL